MESQGTDPPLRHQAVAWGQTYEILAKRGVLACLIEQGLLSREYPILQPWKEIRLIAVSDRLIDSLDIVDQTVRDIVNAAIRHLALTAYGNGYTAMRAYLRQVRERARNPTNLKVKALWCPLTLPGDASQEQQSRERTLQAFCNEFGLERHVDPYWLNKGQPANSDFTLWLAAPDPSDDFLLVQEYSYSMPPRIFDFRDQSAHLEELMRHHRIVNSRSVFSHIVAEVDGDSFELSSDIRNYLGALTSQDKPLYKLCQASSYAETTVDFLQKMGRLDKPCMARAMAMTPHGLESLAARFVPGKTPEPRQKLMRQMGKAYRETEKLQDDDEEALESQREALFRGMVARLPSQLRRNFRRLANEIPKPGEDFLLEVDETVGNFANPSQEFDIEDALSMVDETEALNEYLGGSARKAIAAEMRRIAQERQTITLRDMHAAAIVAALGHARPGRINVLAMEGNPGIGKTTAISRYLLDNKDGYLFFYVSPRVVINRTVAQSLARTPSGEPTGILTLTTNAQLIAAAESWHRKQVENGLANRQAISCAVVADGVRDLRKPEFSSILVMDPKDEETIEREFSARRIHKTQLSEHEDMIRDRNFMGVLRGLAISTRELLPRNPDVNRIVLTAALQGLRERARQRTTIAALSNLFENRSSTPAGRQERRQLAARIPTIIVMVDELSGDNAGVPFVHEIANWLNREFIECFRDAGDTSPFTVVLVLSDASLVNEIVFDRYLNSGDNAPDKIMISESAGERCFHIAVTDTRIAQRKCKTMHVMTNSFPASKLHVQYRMRLNTLRLQKSKDNPGKLQSPREAIYSQMSQKNMENAISDIMKAIDAGAQQVIYFAQDKQFLRDLSLELEEKLKQELGTDQEVVRILDSSVPGGKRKEIVSPEVRDATKVFLMTSSGSRGVSFPMADWIIASFPRFNIEAALMEVAQLIYRGRGHYRNSDGEPVSGDNIPRHLVMNIDDYVIAENSIDKRQWTTHAIDLLTMFLMLRSTIMTRITGDASLHQKIALVPVGESRMEEMTNVMSQYVSLFIKEGKTFLKDSRERELKDIIAVAMDNADEVFSNVRIQGIVDNGADGRSLVLQDRMWQFIELVATPIAPLLVSSEKGTSLPDHVSFSGPLIAEDWSEFDTQESFLLEGHATQLNHARKNLMQLLRNIENKPDFPGSLRSAATNLYAMLYREEKDAANEFRVMKNMKHQKTWIIIPAGYHQFLLSENTANGKPFELHEQECWRDSMAGSMNALSVVMPALAKYKSFPWICILGDVKPMRLDLVFDDRYFMASNELNMLNTLLLAGARV